MIALLYVIGWFGVPMPTIYEARRTDNPALTIHAQATVDAAQIRLSGEVRVRLTVEGPAPLEVTRPKALLSTTGLWRVREDGLPVRQVLLGNRQEWVQEYRLSPLVPGDAVPINLAPLTAEAGVPGKVVIDFKASLPVKVTTAITTPSPDDLRPVTGIEETPPPAEKPAPPPPWWWLAFAGALAVLAVVIDRLRRRPAAIPEAHDAAWAEQQSATAADPDRLAAVLREFLEHRYGQQFASRTPGELAEELRQFPECPPEAVTAVNAFLTACDAARFSGTAGDVAGLRDELRIAVRLTDMTQMNR